MRFAQATHNHSAFRVEVSGRCELFYLYLCWRVKLSSLLGECHSLPAAAATAAHHRMPRGGHITPLFTFIIKIIHLNYLNYRRAYPFGLGCSLYYVRQHNIYFLHYPMYTQSASPPHFPWYTSSLLLLFHLIQLKVDYNAQRIRYILI